MTRKKRVDWRQRAQVAERKLVKLRRDLADARLVARSFAGDVYRCEVCGRWTATAFSQCLACGHGDSVMARVMRRIFGG